jgi:hypothetical protein
VIDRVRGGAAVGEGGVVDGAEQLAASTAIAITRTTRLGDEFLHRWVFVSIPSCITDWHPSPPLV